VRIAAALIGSDRNTTRRNRDCQCPELAHRGCFCIAEPGVSRLAPMQMITDAAARQSTLTINIMPGEIFNLKRALIYSAAWRIHLAQARPHQ
jgi:hypothetical protein